MIEALILGIVRGFAEFLHAHFILLSWFFHWGGKLDSLTFIIAGTWLKI
jgi:undecaprenyl pyrophosphate phosphatase UppP